MVLTSLIRVLRAAFWDFSRNVWLSLTTVMIFTLTLVSAHVLLLVHAAGSVAIRAIEERVDIRVQLRSAVSESDADALRVALERHPEIAGVTQRSRAQVLDDFQREHASDGEILEALAELGENPFGSELRVALRAPADFTAVAALLASAEIAERVAGTTTADRTAVAARLTAVTGRLRSGVLIVSGVLIALTLLIIANAVRIATFARREEVGIMTLVGAPRWFVRSPFLIAGIFAALIATLVAQAVTSVGVRMLAPIMVGIFGARGLDVTGYYWQYGVVIATGEFLALGVLTSVVSAIALRRYLRV